MCSTGSVSASSPRLPPRSPRNSSGPWRKCWPPPLLSSICPLAYCTALALPCGSSTPLHGTISSAMVRGSICTDWSNLVHLTRFDPSNTAVFVTYSPLPSQLPAEARIQRGYQRISSFQGRRSKAGAEGGQYAGVLGQLMERGQLSLDLIKANITELMAGGVDTVCVCVYCMRMCLCFFSFGIHVCNVTSDPSSL